MTQKMQGSRYSAWCRKRVSFHNNTFQRAKAPVSRNNNPVNWWKEHKHRFPRISKVVLEVLCVPLTSTAFERIFSKAGMTVSKLRTCLKPKHVDALVFLNKNNMSSLKYKS